MAPVAMHERRVYVTTATGGPLPRRRLVRSQPNRGAAAGRCPVYLPRPVPARAEHLSRAARELAEVLGCFLGIDLLRLFHFIAALKCRASYFLLEGATGRLAVH